MFGGLCLGGLWEDHGSDLGAFWEHFGSFWEHFGVTFPHRGYPRDLSGKSASQGGSGTPKKCEGRCEGQSEGYPEAQGGGGRDEEEPLSEDRG